MQITFTRTGERDYEMRVTRDDNVSLKVPNFDRPNWLPHDLVHYVIEFYLQLTDGFWGRIAAGAMYPGTVVLEGQQPPHAKTLSKTLIRQVPEAGTESEILVDLIGRIAHQHLENNWSMVQKLLRQAVPPQQSSRPPLEAEEVQQVCRELRRMQQQWSSLAIGESLIVIWPRQISCKPQLTH